MGEILSVMMGGPVIGFHEIYIEKHGVKNELRQRRLSKTIYRPMYSRGLPSKCNSNNLDRNNFGNDSEMEEESILWPHQHQLMQQSAGRENGSNRPESKNDPNSNDWFSSLSSIKTPSTTLIGHFVHNAPSGTPNNPFLDDPIDNYKEIELKDSFLFTYEYSVQKNREKYSILGRLSFLDFIKGTNITLKSWEEESCDRGQENLLVLHYLGHFLNKSFG